jgi:hypothetical protein
MCSNKKAMTPFCAIDIHFPAAPAATGFFAAAAASEGAG